MTERDLPNHDIKPAGDLVRLTVWTEHGTSTKTFRTASEARAYYPILLNKKPARRLE